MMPAGQIGGRILIDSQHLSLATKSQVGNKPLVALVEDFHSDILGRILIHLGRGSSSIVVDTPAAEVIQSLDSFGIFIVKGATIHSI